MQRRTIFTTIASLAVAGLALTGCSSGSEPAAEETAAEMEQVKFQLNWAWGGATAGYAVTETDGYDIENGVEIDFQQGNGSAPAAQIVASGQMDMGNADATVIAQQIQSGADLVVLAVQNQVPVISLQALPETGLESVADLAGKSVGFPTGTSQQFLLPLLLDNAGLSMSDIQEVNIQTTALVPSVMEGNVDVVVGDVQISPLQFAAQNQEFDEVTFAEGGLDIPSQSIFTSRKFLEENPEAVRRALAAILDGWADTIVDPENAGEAVNSLMADVPVETTVGELARTPWLMCGPGTNYLGLGEPERVSKGLDLILEAGLIEDEIAVDDMYDFSYLPETSDLYSCADLYKE